MEMSLIDFMESNAVFNIILVTCVPPNADF